ncbi:MAG TPA: hypothetical protein VLK58_23000 [Conexibacter sp.]|nr:hypothetical protein [Conexibacter sp.]
MPSLSDGSVVSTPALRLTDGAPSAIPAATNSGVREAATPLALLAGVSSAAFAASSSRRLVAVHHKTFLVVAMPV